MEDSQRTSIVALASSLLADLRRLVAQELQRAKHEMQDELSKLVKASIQAGEWGDSDYRGIPAGDEIPGL